MPKRKAKRIAKKPAASNVNDTNGILEEDAFVEQEEQKTQKGFGFLFFRAIEPHKVTSQRLSIGMTPKTLRLPKQGEMLLSVHGSPLGVYKENNMDAINETEEELPTN
nr:hypothetical protein [Tanacetum cinerariifolium]